MSADEYTPTTEEVREAWAAVRTTMRRGYLWPALGEDEPNGEFDRMLALHDAEVARAAKAEALEEAADSIPGYKGTPQLGWAPVPGWLRARAAEYRKVATDE